MPERLDLDLLRSLVTAVETESVTAAAQRLGLTQPTVSKHIAELEARYGTRLLHRDGRGVRPTALCLRLAARATSVLDRVTALDGAATVAVHRQVRVALPPTVAELAVVPLVTGVRARDPALRLEIAEGFSEQAAACVRDGSSQAGVVYGLADLHGLAVMATFSDTLHFVFPARDRATAADAPMDRAAVQAMDFVLPSRPHGLRTLVDGWCARLGITLRIAYEMASLGTIRQLVLAGRAASVLPFNAVAADVRAGRMRLGRSEDLALVRHLAVVSAAARPRGPDVALAMEELCAVLERELAYVAQELRLAAANAVAVRLAQ